MFLAFLENIVYNPKRDLLYRYQL